MPSNQTAPARQPQGGKGRAKRPAPLTPEERLKRNREIKRKAQAKYQKTAKGKATTLRYRKTEKQRIVWRRYNKTEKGKARVKKCRSTEAGRMMLYIYRHTDKERLRFRLAKQRQAARQGG